MIAVVFPGQGSQKPGMGKDLCERYGAAQQVFTEVESATGIPIRTVCFDTDEDTLRQTQNAQIALYTCGAAAWSALSGEAPGIEVKFMAGHSIGEYAALACTGVVSIGDGARLVQKRGEVMADSGKLRAGGMAAIMGLERAALEAVCAEATTPTEVVVVANDNCPGQLVVSGDKAAVDRACGLATQKGAKRALPLNVSGAFHSPLMEEPAKAMGSALRSVEFRQSSGAAVVCNVTAQPENDPSQWRHLLEAQLRNPVRWTESVQRMIADGAGTFIECGGGEVLGGLIRRIDKEAKSLKVADAESLSQTLAALA